VGLVFFERQQVVASRATLVGPLLFGRRWHQYSRDSLPHPTVAITREWR
jgi:hypothetical protein